MQINESIIVEHNSRLHNVIHRGFRYDKEATVWFYRKVNKQRFREHSNKCFDHAHSIIRRYLAEEDIDWEMWRIGFVGRCSNGEFYGNRVNFQIQRRKKKSKK